MTASKSVLNGEVLPHHGKTSTKRNSNEIPSAISPKTIPLRMVTSASHKLYKDS